MGIKSRAMPGFLLGLAVPYARQGISVGAPSLESHDLHQTLPVLGQAVVFLEERTVIIGVAVLHDQSFVRPAAARRRRFARPERRISRRGRGVPMVRRCRATMRLTGSVHGLAHSAGAAGNKGHHAGDLLDFELFSGQRRPAPSAPAEGIIGPPGPPAGMGPPPRRPRPSEAGLLCPAAPWLNWAWARRWGSSLSASLSFQRPVKSTPGGGPCSSFSLAQAARHSTARAMQRRMAQSYIEGPAAGIRNQPAERRRGAARRSLGPLTQTRPSKG